MENVRKISKKYYLRQVVACWLVCYMALGIPAQIALAPPPPLPQGWEIVAGSVGDFDYGTVPGDLYIKNIANGTIIKWNDGFNISSAAWTDFQFIIDGSAVLNRDVTGSMSQIYGKLTANGNVWIVNPAGIIFGETARIDVTQLVASSLNILDADFLNGAPYHFYDGAGAGEVRNESPDTLTAELIYLIGKHVINTGSLRALNGYVVMAAGDTVTISEVGSSVAVEVTLPPLVDTGEYLVDHHGDGKINAQHVILAAGDIWASAYIKAYSDGGSDAVASVLIDAAGDVTIDDEITAEADALGASDNATATVLIDAGGDVFVNDNVTADAEALVDGPGSATADVDIIAGGNVTVTGSGSNVTADAEVDGSAATATVDIDAGGNVTVDDGYIQTFAHTEDSSSGTGGDLIATTTVNAEGDFILGSAYNGDEAYIYAKAYTGDSSTGGAGDLTATVDIDATNFNFEYGEIDAYAFTGTYSEGTVGNLTAKVDIDTVGGDVTVGNAEEYTDGEIYAKAYTGSGSTGDADNLTATIDIDAVGGDVDVYYDSYIEAYAYTGSGSTGDATGNLTATVDIDATNVNLEYGDIDAYAYTGSWSEGDVGNLTALVDIDATGDVTLGSAENDGDGYIEAKAFTGYFSKGGADTLTGTVDIDATNFTFEYGEIETCAYTGTYSEGTVLDLTAKVDIDATGDVTVGTSEYDGYEGDIYAKAYTGGLSTGDARNLTGTVDIDATNVTLEYADIYAYAYTGGSSEGTVVGNLSATATVNADGDVTLGNAKDGDEGRIYADAWTGGSSLGGAGNLAATTTVNSGGNVTVEDGDIETKAYTDSPSSDDVGNLTATTTVNADGDVTLGSAEYGQEGYIKADAHTSGSGTAGNLTATTTVNSGGNVTLNDDSDMYADAEAGFGSGDATATVNITTTGSDVTVGYDSDIYAEADVYTNEALLGDPENGPETRDATAEVTILADGQVTVEEGGEIYTDAVVHINYYEVSGAREGDPVPVVIPGDATATTTIKADTGVTVEGSSGCGSPGQIYADAGILYHFGDSGLPFEVEDRPDATATVDIQTCGNVIVDGDIRSNAWINDTSMMSYPDSLLGDATANTEIRAYGDVIVNSEDGIDNGSNGQIKAEARSGFNNSAGVTILAVGDVIVNNGTDTGHPRPFLNSREEIRAAAHDGSTNNAFVHIATREGDAGNVEVSGQIGARTWDAWYIEVEGGEDILGENTSNVEIYADQDVIVNGGYALYGQGIESQVFLESHEGGQIFAGAQGSGPPVKGESLRVSNTANVEIYAGRDVIVHGAELEYTDELVRPNGGGGGFFDGGQIIALTRWNNYSENTSSIGIYAQRDVTIGATTVTGEPMHPIQLTLADSGQVIAGAHGDSSLNDADIEICAQDDVTIDGVVEATAGTGAGGWHFADIRIAAGDELGGSGSIIADADEHAGTVEASVTFFVTNLGKFLFDGDAFSVDSSVYGEEIIEEPEIEIGPVDCPDCDFDWIDWLWCIDCEEPGPPAPFPDLQLPMISGCPVETQAAASELGITPETIQVSIANALALSPDIHPCEACARLIDAARILSDEDGSLMAATIQAFNSLAPADAPFTPEMGASIVTALGIAAEGTQYASVAEYIDAFVEYVTVLETELGAPVGDSTVFAMEKYGAGIAENANIAAYVEARLAGL